MKKLPLVFLLCFILIISGCNGSEPEISKSESIAPSEVVESTEPQESEIEDLVVPVVSTRP